MSGSRRGDLRELYAQQLAARGFQEDEGQLAVVGHLDLLRRRLIDAAGVAAGARGLLAKLRRGPTPAIRGVYLCGGVGRGKTWLMDLFFNSLPFAERRRRHFHRFMQETHTALKALGEVSSPLEQVAEGIAREARVLCFDELFVSDIADAMILGTLFEALVRRHVTLVFTSNVAPRDLYKDGLQRQRFIPAIEILERHTQVIALDGAVDYRLRQLTQAGTYLPSSDVDTPQRLEKLFHEMADGTGHSGGTLDIEGRAIPIVREAGSVVWFDFAALCEGPRSAADYIEIARDYQTVILSDVPVLDETRDNAARRLIALVDELYDRNVNLIVSAAAAPSELYSGERLRLQFARTASRLVEMQSEEYLAREHRG